jgi:hypothetical protein
MPNKNDPGSLPWVVWKLLMSLCLILSKLLRTLERAHGGTHAQRVHTHGHGRNDDRAQHRVVFLPEPDRQCQVSLPENPAIAPAALQFSAGLPMISVETLS